MKLFAALSLLGMPSAAASPSCTIYNDTDINPHTAGLGSIPGAAIGTCCDACASAEWQAKGCRFFTLSIGQCWFKASADTKVPAPGKISGGVPLVPTPPPAPTPPPPP